jgi:hypothetical protein
MMFLKKTEGRKPFGKPRSDRRKVSAFVIIVVLKIPVPLS